MLKVNKIYIEIQDDNSRHLLKEIEVLKSILDINTNSKLVKHLIYNFRKSLNDIKVKHQKIPLTDINQFLKKYQ